MALNYVNNKKWGVVGLGNCSMDTIIRVPEEFFQNSTYEKHKTQIIDASTLDHFLSLPDKTSIPGGTVANSMNGVASCGGKAAFIGTLGTDKSGTSFRQGFKAPHPFVYYNTPRVKHSLTTHCIVLVTPDSQRTCLTYMDAGSKITESDLDMDLLKDCRILMLDGYLLYAPQGLNILTTAARAARSEGAAIALNLSDTNLIKHQRSGLKALAPYVDIILGNESEALEFTGASSRETAIADLRQMFSCGAITLGAAGAALFNGACCLHSPSVKVPRIVDTTGAGDHFAGGFLHGLSQKRRLDECGYIGNYQAARVIQCVGGRLEVERQIAPAPVSTYSPT